MVDGFTDIPQAELDEFYLDAVQRSQETKDRKSWDALRDVVLAENEYKRRGWKTPHERGM